MLEFKASGYGLMTPFWISSRILDPPWNFPAELTCLMYPWNFPSPAWLLGTVEDVWCTVGGILSTMGMRGILSTMGVGVSWVQWEDILNTVGGYLKYHRGYLEYYGGISWVLWGCSVPWRDIISTLGMFSTPHFSRSVLQVRCHDTCVGMFSTPTFFMISPTVLKV